MEQRGLMMKIFAFCPIKITLDSSTSDFDEEKKSET